MHSFRSPLPPLRPLTCLAPPLQAEDLGGGDEEEEGEGEGGQSNVPVTQFSVLPRQPALSYLSLSVSLCLSLSLRLAGVRLCARWSSTRLELIGPAPVSPGSM
jgi:hypothetical protein